jgi:hypothetical protein
MGKDLAEFWAEISQRLSAAKKECLTAAGVAAQFPRHAERYHILAEDIDRALVDARAHRRECERAEAQG